MNEHDTELWFIVVLAVVQGITEFLPVSSSGHLAVAQFFLGMEEAGLTVEVALHLGTLIAVLTFYRRDLAQLARNGVAGGSEGARARRMIGLLALANVPAGLVGVLLKSRIEAAFGSPLFVAMAFLVTGTFLWSTRRLTRGDGAVDVRRGLLMGCAQALAILPGFSRSGWTIAVGLMLGVRPADAARFSFLMSIPAVTGAALLQFRDAEPGGSSWVALAAGAAVAALVGLACLTWLVRLVRNMSLHRFSPYLWLLGTLLAAGLLWR